MSAEFAEPNLSCLRRVDEEKRKKNKGHIIEGYSIRAGKQEGTAKETISKISNKEKEGDSCSYKSPQGDWGTTNIQ